MAASKRDKRPFDMLMSLAVLLIPVLAIAWLFTNPGETTPKAVDWRPVLAQARFESPYLVLAPVALPDTWTVTQARWTKAGDAGIGGALEPGNRWQLGLIDPDGTFISLNQRDAATDALASQVSRSGREDGTSVVGDVDYQRRVTDDGRTRSLVAKDGAVITIVSGDTSYAGLEAFASTLAAS